MNRRLPFLSIIICVFIATLCFLRIQVPLLDYPFLFPDSFDWLMNGLEYANVLPGHSEISHRGMLMTLVLAFLYKIDQIQLATILGTLSLGLLCLSLVILLSPSLTRRTVMWATVLNLISFTTLGQSAYVGADSIANLCASVFSLGMILMVLQPGTGLMYALGVVGGLGAHSQNIFPILAPLYLAILCWGLITHSRFRYMVFSRHGLGALLIFCLLIFVFLLPRWSMYGTFYEERVQHASLISFSLAGSKYYISALVSSFSWPICVLATIGAFIGWRSGGTSRIYVFFFLVWIFNVFAFFAWLYSWRDVRFWIYGSVPLLTLAAMALDFLSIVSNRFIYALISCVAVYSIHSPPTNDPWDRSIMITPWRAISFLGNGVYRFDRILSLPFLKGHLTDLSDARQASLAGIQTGMRDPDLQKIVVAAAPLAGPSQIAVFGELSPDWHYIAKNRNQLYIRSNRVILITDPEHLKSFLSQGNLAICRRDISAKVLSELNSMPIKVSELYLPTANTNYTLIGTAK